MYHSGKNPLRRITRTSEEVLIPKGLKIRRLHKAFLRYHDPNNWPLLREALRRMGRADLIGNGRQQLVPAYQPAGTGGSPAGAARGPAYAAFARSTPACRKSPRLPGRAAPSPQAAGQTEERRRGPGAFLGASAHAVPRACRDCGRRPRESRVAVMKHPCSAPARRARHLQRRASLGRPHRPLRSPRPGSRFPRAAAPCRAAARCRHGHGARDQRGARPCDLALRGARARGGAKRPAAAWWCCSSTLRADSTARCATSSARSSPRRSRW